MDFVEEPLDLSRNNMDNLYYVYRPPFKPKYLSIFEREKSFTNEFWDNFHISKSELAKAGFFSLNDGDKVCCFSCSLCLTSWGIDDDPWIEHYDKNRNCLYIRLNKEEVNKRKKIYNNEMRRFIQKQFEKELITELLQTVNKSLLRSVLIKRFTDGEYNFIDMEEAKNCIKTFDNNKKLEDPILEYYICRICCGLKMNIACIPCGHITFCSYCAPCFNKCIECRTEISAFIKVFLP